MFLFHHSYATVVMLLEAALDYKIIHSSEISQLRKMYCIIAVDKNKGKNEKLN